MKRTKMVALGLAVVGVGAAGYAFLDRADTPDVTISTVEVSRGNVVQEVQSSGTLEAVKTVQVGTQVSGIIKSLDADFNSIVHKGQVIATLDPSALNTQIGQARATLVRLKADLDRLQVQVDSTKRTLDRTTELASRKLVSQADLDAASVDYRMARAQWKSAQAQVVQAQAQLNQTQVSLDHTIIRSPIDGIVISRDVDVGQTVAASMSAPTLFVIAEDLRRMQAAAAIDEADVGSVRPGQVVRFTVDAYAAQEFSGRVTQVRLEPTVLQNVVTYTAMIDVPNPDLRLMPGMTANVVVEVARRDDVLRIPSAALRFKPNVETLAPLGMRVSEPSMPGSGKGGGIVLTSQPVDGTRNGITRAVLTSGAGQGVPAMAAVSDGPVGGGSPGESAVTSKGTVWLADGQTLKPVRVTLGVSDGSYVELVAGNLEAGTELVTRVAAAVRASSSPSAPVSSPFLPSRGGWRGR